jgi:4-amino-4-deoxy-L-arabinose transferase-like glycosyltransferase
VLFSVKPIMAKPDELAAGQTAAPESPSRRVLIFAVLALVLAIRLIQLLSAMSSPLTYQPGPDEDYYRRFGEAVAAGQGAQNSPEFTFMDPAYGYILGALFKVVGPNLFVVYLLQVLLDTATAYGIVTVGRLLGRPRAGLIGATLYGLTATAVMFCTTLLKEVWVTAFLTWWVVAALTLVGAERDRKWRWVLLGVYAGLGIGLRSTLLLVCGVTLLLPLWQSRKATVWAPKAALVACGLLVGLLPWSVRNDQAYGSLAPVPHNSGIILHQVYNEQNPNAEIWIPPFVSYLHPSEIWQGYAAEASRRAGRQLSPVEVDRYWHDEALTFMEQHPAQVAGDILRKGLGWLSSNELANNRSDTEERMFSPILAVLPSPAAWLLGLGLVGLLWLALQDNERKRWLIVAVPIGLAWFTMAVFFAESRFRFHAASMLALCSGVFVEQFARRLDRRRALAAFGALAVVIVATSMVLGARAPSVPVRWDRIAWGYINMGKIREAQSLSARISQDQPDNAAIFEALGYTDAVTRQYEQAAQAFQHAIALRPSSHVAHFNLARVYLKLGDRQHAAEEAGIAVKLHPSPDYESLLSQIEAGS